MQNTVVNNDYASSEHLERKIFMKRVKLLLASTTLTNISHSILAILFVFLLWGRESSIYLLIWLVIMLVIFISRGLLSRFFNRTKRTYEDTKKLINYYIVASSLTGMGWGAGSVIFFPHDDVTMQYIIIFMIVGIGLAVINVLSVVPLAMYGLVLPLILPINIVFLLKGDQTSVALSLMILFSIVFLMKSGKNNYRIIYDNIALQLAEAEANNQLKRAIEEANKANKAKSEFLSRMSHELRTPMNAILGFAQILELDSHTLSNEQNENLNEITQAGHHLLYLINEVLDLAKIESGKMEISIEAIQPYELIQQTITLLQSQISQKKIKVEDNSALVKAHVFADSMRLKQVIINILNNAIKYNSLNGHIYIDLAQTDKYLQIKIRDTGIGISEENLKQLFVPFNRFETTSSIEGAGIGLVISHYLMELMGGSIYVESTLGEGSCFILELSTIKQNTDSNENK